LVEVAAGFVLPCSVELAHMIGLAVGETIGAGAPIVLLPFGALACGSKIDQFSHVAAVTGYVVVRPYRGPRRFGESFAFVRPPGDYLRLHRLLY
jgi:hypothetical protein